MRSKRILVFLMVAVLAGHTAVYAESDAGAEANKAQSPSSTHEAIQSRSATTLDELGQLDSEIECLKKQLEIKKLKQEIKEIDAENKQGQKQIMPFGLGQQMQQMSLNSPAFPEAPAASEPSVRSTQLKPKANVAADAAGEKTAMVQEFNAYLSLTRVVSIRGFGKNIQAEIRLPNGGVLSVEEGQKSENLGKVKHVSPKRVILTKFDQDYSVPFTERFNRLETADATSEMGRYMDPRMDSAAFYPGPQALP